ncbi:AAA family ATPase, partial [Aeromonas caviae]|uniref:AAA family ATPase n=1 Tax=Aeromonas caviae TaxID=648 RepID=UPI0035A2346E
MLRLEVHHVAACHAASDGHSRFQRPEALAGRAGARLIVLDTLSRIHSLDENSNGDMARLVATLEHIA